MSSHQSVDQKSAKIREFLNGHLYEDSEIKYPRYHGSAYRKSSNLQCTIQMYYDESISILRLLLHFESKLSTQIKRILEFLRGI